ncbi:Hypothetical predicted protein [Olea europaea subsp. europaea]|uniref:Pentatricopeptide repeat-containing protein n=1 Tax=Olea europaea subsp. europaea TaxID=158383 RepID=A0A8S0V8X4_OLEEU|nr:Hypothetical predicted protein [Olea europaea subsp. europaea]
MGKIAAMAVPRRADRLLQILNKTTTVSLSQGHQAHAHLLKTGISNVPRHTTKLVSLYANHQCFSDAESLLNSFSGPDLFAFSTLIYAYTKFNEFKRTLRLFSEMFCDGLFPDAHILPSVIKACSGLSVLEIGKQVHGHFYVKCNELVDARKVFDNMVERDMVSWSALAAGYARKGDVVSAIKVFEEGKKLGFELNSVSWNGMIARFNQSGFFVDAVLMFHEMHLRGFKSDGTGL